MRSNRRPTCPGRQRAWRCWRERDPSQLLLRLRQGLVLVASRWPVVTIWRAHRHRDNDRFAPVRAAFARGVAETALVARDGWRPTVNGIDEATRRFTAALQRGAHLAHALDEAGDGFQFDEWLHDAVRQQWLLAVAPVADRPDGGTR